MKNGNFIKLVCVFGVLLGVMNTLGTIIGIICAQYDFTDSQASLFGAVFIVGGILGSGVAGTIVELKKNYKVVTCVLSASTAVTPIGLLFAMKNQNVVWTTTWSLIVGSASISIIPVGIDFGVELTHPVAESISSGLLLSTGQLVGIVLTIVSSLLITYKGDAGVIWGWVIIITCAGAASLLSLFIKQDLRRRDME